MNVYYDYFCILILVERLRQWNTCARDGPQEEAGSWVQGQAEGHTQGVQKGNSTGREKASYVIRELRQ
jgi:hypothetical protein